MECPSPESEEIFGATFELICGGDYVSTAAVGVRMYAILAQFIRCICTHAALVSLSWLITGNR